MDTLGRFSAIFTKEITLWLFVCLLVHEAPSEKGQNIPLGATRRVRQQYIVKNDQEIFSMVILPRRAVAQGAWNSVRNAC